MEGGDGGRERVGADGREGGAAWEGGVLFGGRGLDGLVGAHVDAELLSDFGDHLDQPVRVRQIHERLAALAPRRVVAAIDGGEGGADLGACAGAAGSDGALDD